MERHTGKWRSFPCALFLLVFASVCESVPVLNATEPGVKCKEIEYRSQSNRFCCDRCLPGYKLGQECPGEGMRSRCDRCRNGTYMDGMNILNNCFRCHSCNKQHGVVREPCRPDRNTECGCESGYFKESIDEETWICRSCRECGEGERQITPCAWNRDTVCECKEDYYRKSTNICVPCTNCSSKCIHLCPKNNGSILKTTTFHPAPDPGFPRFIVYMLLVGAGLIGGLLLFMIFRKGKKMFHKQSSKSDEGPDQERTVEMIHTCPPVTVDETVPLSSPPNLGLPDCIPKEIKTHEFIYFVLDLIPISRFKELVRHLGVSEQDIDRAERDHRAFADAQYQMLTVWLTSSAGAGKSVVSRPLLQQFMDVLKDINLYACAESVEEKYWS